MKETYRNGLAEVDIILKYAKLIQNMLKNNKKYQNYLQNLYNV